jgi:hypothetical protein
MASVRQEAQAEVHGAQSLRATPYAPAVEEGGCLDEANISLAGGIFVLFVLSSAVSPLRSPSAAPAASLSSE